MELDYSGISEAVQGKTHPILPSGEFNKSACVFLLLCNPSDPYILFILKADNEGYPWRNQTTLPGGHIDTGDATPLMAAYREIYEELNIENKYVDYIGSIGHYQTTNHRDIEAFLGLWNGEGDLRFDPKEIAKIVKIPMEALYRTHINNNYRFELPEFDKLLYPFDDIVVRGATARIIHYFLNLTFPHILP